MTLKISLLNIVISKWESESKKNLTRHPIVGKPTMKDVARTSFFVVVIAYFEKKGYNGFYVN